MAGIVLLIAAGVAVAQSDEADVDYAPSKPPSAKRVMASRPIDPAGINIVSGNPGSHEPDFSNAFMNHMNLWMAARKPGACRIEWKLQAPADGMYEVDALAAGKGSRLLLTCNGQKQKAEAELSTTASFGWARASLGTIHLTAGENSLRLDVEATKGFKFDALEIVQPAVKADLLKDALAMRQKPDWFRNAGYGLMFQWTNRATPPKGPIKPWEEKVNDFDLDSFVKTVEQSGAAYVLWSVTWGNQYISAPIQSLDEIIKGRTTKRDLLGEMADALQARGIKLIFYYHYGYDCNHSVDADWMKASGGYKADKTEFYKNWMAIVSEIGNRYGDKLHGWWFDGGQRYYNCHYDGTPGDKGILSAPFKELTLAARSGNPERVVAYNSWIKPRLTEYQDYYGGEGAHVASGLDKGSFPSGPQQGLLAHGCFIFESKWGHIEPNTVISKPKYSLKKLTSLVRKAQQEQSPLSINLEMYEGGSVSPDSVALLKQLKAALLETPAGERNDKPSMFDFKAKRVTSWESDAYSGSEKSVWDGADLSGMTLAFSGHNFGFNDSMRKVDFSGSTISTNGNQAFLFVDLSGANFSNANLHITGFKRNMNAFRKAKLAGTDFSGIKWAVSTTEFTEKTEAFFSGGPGSASAEDKHRAVTFEGADLSCITGAAKAAMIRNLGGFDGKTAIGAKYDQAMLTKSGWAAAELNAADWQKVQ